MAKVDTFKSVQDFIKEAEYMNGFYIKGFMTAKYSNSYNWIVAFHNSPNEIFVYNHDEMISILTEYSAEGMNIIF